MIYSDELNAIFFEQANDLMREIKLNIASFKRNSSNREYLKKIFSYIHTLKGSGAFLEKKNTFDICVRVESALKPILNKSKIDSQTIDALNSAFMLIKSAVESDKRGEINTGQFEFSVQDIAFMISPSYTKTG